MEPAELARILRDVQDCDTKIIGLRREIEGLEDKHHLSELRDELESAREARAGKEAELEELKHKQLKLDGELDILAQKIEKEEARMMSGTIMNPKELSAIQTEIFSLRKKRDEMETEDLEEMEAIDGLRGDLTNAAELISRVTEREEVALKTFEEELVEKESQVAELEAERDGQKARIDEDILAAYEKLLVDKDGLAVVDILQGRSCGGCRIDFSRTQIDRFQHEEGVFRCEYCRRMLVK